MLLFWFEWVAFENRTQSEPNRLYSMVGKWFMFCGLERMEKMQPADSFVWFARCIQTDGPFYEFAEEKNRVKIDVLLEHFLILQYKIYICCLSLNFLCYANDACCARCRLQSSFFCHFNAVFFFPPPWKPEQRKTHCFQTVCMERILRERNGPIAF